MAEPATPHSAAAPGQGAARRPQVIYVLGAGRSGSTVLGVTLGNVDGVFYAGELDAWLPRSAEPQLQDEPRLRFWGRVRERVSGAEPLFGWQAQRSIDRSLALFRVRMWPVRRRIRGEYRRVSQAVYEAVMLESGARVIVDTSHYPLRLRELQTLDGVDMYVVYLMRDPQSVVASFNRKDVAQYSKATFTTNTYLWLTNALAVAVFLRQPRGRRLFVRYETFIARPHETIREIVTMAGLDAPDPDLEQLRTGMAFQGNRLIHSDVISLDRRPPKPAPRSWLTAIAQLPWTAVLSRLSPAAGRDA